MPKRLPAQVSRMRATVFNRRETCNPYCLYFFRCPYAKYDKDNESECGVRKLTDKELERFINLVVMEEEGFRNEAVRILWELGEKIDKDNLKDVRMYLEMVALVSKSFKTKPQKEKDEPIEIKAVTMPASRVIEIPVISPENDKESLFDSKDLDKIIMHKTKKMSKK